MDEYGRVRKNLRYPQRKYRLRVSNFVTIKKVKHFLAFQQNP
jgi:hypothetical protein